MTRVAIVNPQGEIEQMYSSGVNVEPEGLWAPDNTREVYHVIDALDTATFMARRYLKGSEFVERAAKPGDYYDWADEAWVLSVERLMVEIRRERTYRLFQCDWTQGADAPLTDAEKAEWVEYRAGLRSVPATNDEVTHLDQVVWPDAP